MINNYNRLPLVLCQMKFPKRKELFLFWKSFNIDNARIVLEEIDI